MGVLADGFNKRDLEAGIGMVTYFDSRRAHRADSRVLRRTAHQEFWIEENFTAL